MKNPFKTLERKIEMSFIQKMLVGFIERSCKHYVTTIIGILSVLLYAFNTFGTLIPVQYHDLANMAAVVIQGVALLLAKDSNNGQTVPTPNKLAVPLILLMLMTLALAPVAQAQQPVNFTAESSAVAFHFDGGWSAATHITESYDFYDFGATKNSRLYVSAHQFIAPEPGINIYAAGLRLSPDLSTVMTKFNVPPNMLNVEFGAALGNGLPASGGSHISAIIDGRIKYRATSALTWNALEVGYVRFGSYNGAAISTGLSYVFGGPKN